MKTSFGRRFAEVELLWGDGLAWGALLQATVLAERGPGRAMGQRAHVLSNRGARAAGRRGGRGRRGRSLRKMYIHVNNIRDAEGRKKLASKAIQTTKQSNTILVRIANT